MNSLVTVGVRDIQGEGFPDDLWKADSVFLDLPQPWLAIPSVGKMLGFCVHSHRALSKYNVLAKP